MRAVMGKAVLIILTVAAFLGGAAGGDMINGSPGGGPRDTDKTTEAPQDHGSDGAQRAAPDAAPESLPGDSHAPAETGASRGQAQGAAAQEMTWFQFPQQFFVPVLHGGQLDSTMVLSLSVEFPGAAAETVFAHEIKLRDALLRQLLIHANTGGFDGNFTSDAHLVRLRTELAKTANGVVPEISGVLIGDIARQDR